MAELDVLEEAVRQRLLAHFSDILVDARIRAGDPDTVIENVFNSDSDYGVFIEFDGGYPEPQASMSNESWVWQYECLFLIRYRPTNDVENLMRTVVKRLRNAFAAPNHILGGITPRARIVSIGSPDPGAINDTPFYFVPFTVTAVQR